MLSIFSIRGTQNCFPEPQRSIVRDDIETVIFGNNHDQVIIATTSGSIKVIKYIYVICINIMNDKSTQLKDYNMYYFSKLELIIIALSIYAVHIY